MNKLHFKDWRKYMNKAVLVIDMPDSCYSCPLDCESYGCTVTGSLYFRRNKRFNPYEGKLEDCPLKELPERTTVNWLDDNAGFCIGWNAFRDKIMEENNE